MVHDAIIDGVVEAEVVAMERHNQCYADDNIVRNLCNADRDAYFLVVVVADMAMETHYYLTYLYYYSYY